MARSEKIRQRAVRLGELGALVFFGRAGRYSSAGPAFGVRLGWDIFRWLDVQAHLMGSNHDAQTPPPTSGQSFQTLLYAGEIRLKAQIRRFQLFAEGGAGLGQITSNVLDQVGVTNGHLFTLAVIAGGGLDYHTLNRHFSVGLGVDYLARTTGTTPARSPRKPTSATPTRSR